MRKLLITLTCMVGFLSTTSVLADNKIGVAFDQGFGVTGQFNEFNAFIGNDGLSGDYIFDQGSFGNDFPFDWYVGGGGYYNWSDKSIGARVPLGLTLPFAKKWDVYGQVAPVLDYNLDHSKFNFELDFAIGIRYAF